MAASHLTPIVSGGIRESVPELGGHSLWMRDAVDRSKGIDVGPMLALREG